VQKYFGKGIEYRNILEKVLSTEIFWKRYSIQKCFGKGIECRNVLEKVLSAEIFWKRY
jgi:hypothetical protein